MFVLSVALTLADAAFGAPFPAGTVFDGPRISATMDPHSEHSRCYLNYKLRSDASIATIAQFYLQQARDENAKLLGDTREQFPNYRTMSFAEPNYMFVVLSRDKKATTAAVTLRMPDGCRAPTQSAGQRP